MNGSSGVHAFSSISNKIGKVGKSTLTPSSLVLFSSPRQNELDERKLTQFTYDKSDNSLSPESSRVLPRTRKVASIQKYARLPVWPVWNGVIIFFLSKLGIPNTTITKLEDIFGGRVCPNFFNDQDPATAMSTSPFIMLVHHMHSFTSIACSHHSIHSGGFNEK